MRWLQGQDRKESLSANAIFCNEINCQILKKHNSSLTFQLRQRRSQRIFSVLFFGVISQVSNEFHEKKQKTRLFFLILITEEVWAVSCGSCFVSISIFFNLLISCFCEERWLVYIALSKYVGCLCFLLMVVVPSGDYGPLQGHILTFFISPPITECVG